MRDLRTREFNPLKIMHHAGRLRALADGRDVAPVTVEVDPVAFCNHRCSWCVDPVHVRVRMSDATFEALMTELSEWTIGGFAVQGIVFKGGGEPTLHPQFGAMVERAAGLGFAVGVVTNGSRLTRWAGVLAHHGAYVRVSIDGPTPESHRRIHRSSDFDAIIDGVDELLAERRCRRHPVVGLSFAIDVHTLDLARQAVALGEQLRVDYVLLRPPFFEEVGREPTMSAPEARQVRRRLSELARDYDGGIDLIVGDWVGDAEQEARLDASGRRDLQRTPSIPIEHRTGRCPASPLLAVVTAEGELFGCCNLRALPRWSFGHLDYGHGIGIAELWHGQQRRETLARMHAAECLAHCTHPMSRYNEIIEVLRDPERPHSQFV